MEQSFQPRGKLLARNTLLNVAGYGAPLLVGVVAMPYVIRGLGAASFGILSIAWVLLAYLSFFDLGFGKAATKYVAECLGRGDNGQIARWVWTSVGLELVFGVAGAAVFGAVTPLLAERVLKIPPNLIRDAKVSFFLLAASLPVVLVTNGLRGVLEAAQRFDLINYVRVPVNTSVFLLPAIGVAFGLHLPGIVLLLVLTRVGGALAYLMLAVAVFPALRRSFSFSPKLVRPLASFGGWITVSNVVSPLLTYVDRFFIGALLSMAAVAYYAAPYEAVTRAGLILPASLATTLFPAFSSLDAVGARERVAGFYVRSLKLLLLALGPVLLLVVVFAHTILHLWLGAGFAQKSTLTLQILAVGVLINALAGIPFILLPSFGRPDLPAKFLLLELPIYASLLWFLIGRMGIAGVALAWTLRVGLDAVLLFGACAWLRIVPLRALGERHLLRSILAVSGLALALLVALLTRAALAIQVGLAAAAILLFGVVAWSLAMDDADKTLLAAAASHFAVAFGRSK